jgi:DNA-binding transcriptional ArsR family regulator
MAMIMSVDDTADQTTQLKKMAALFHALADPTRLLILEHLVTGEHKVKELTEHLGLAQSTVSAHLACLRESDLVSVRIQGRASLYSRTESAQLSLILTQAVALASVTASEHHWHEEHPNQPEEA